MIHANLTPKRQVTHTPLADNVVFAMNGREGTVIQTRHDSHLVYWAELIDGKTGEVHSPITSQLLFEDVDRADLAGKLTILRDPSVPEVTSEPGRRDRSVAEVERQDWRRAHVEAAKELIASGDMGRTRAEFIANREEINERAQVLFTRYRKERRKLKRPRAGAPVELGPDRGSPDSGDSIHRWYLKDVRNERRVELGAATGQPVVRAELFDAYRNCGWRGNRLSKAEDTLLRSIVSARLQEEDPTISSILDSVRSAFKLHNQSILPGVTDTKNFRIPGRQVVRNAIDDIAPIEHKIRTHGLRVAYRDMHAVGIGITTYRALQRVEIDEYTMDLNVFLEETGILRFLSEAQKRVFGLDGRATRLVISAAIDVHTRCIVALKFSTAPSAMLLKETVEMIFTEKTRISDAVAELSWIMSGRPETIVLDRGPAYIANETYDVLAELGITNQGAPAGMPWLRGFIERLFRTIHMQLLQRFAGRTFSDVVQKGEYNAEGRTSVNLEDLLALMARWIVDIYHNQPHTGLNGATPYQAWVQATAASKPRRMTRSDMRMTFGIRDTRKVSRTGIVVGKVDYWCDEIGGLIGKELEIAWWRGDVGTIEVRLGPDRWLTVQATDPQWIGKTFEDVQQHFSRSVDAEGRDDAARNRAVVDLDRFAQHQSALRGLLFTGMTPEMLREAEEDFRRHTVSASRMLDAPEPEDLFAGVIDLSPLTEAEVPPAQIKAAPGDDSAHRPAPRSDHKSSQPNLPAPPVSFEADIDDLME